MSIRQSVDLSNVSYPAAIGSLELFVSTARVGYEGSYGTLALEAEARRGYNEGIDTKCGVTGDRLPAIHVDRMEDEAQQERWSQAFSS